MLTPIISAFNQSFSSDSKVTTLANRYYDVFIEYQQPYSYGYQFSVERDDKFLINDLNLIKRYQDRIDIIHQQLLTISINDLSNNRIKIFYQKFLENVEAKKGKRICKSELWNINHMSGAHTLLDSLIYVQPLQTDKNKADALLRWNAASTYYDQEIINLNKGLKLGYSMPKRVVKRLITQLQSLTSMSADAHPYLKLLNRTDDKTFKSEFTSLIKKQLLPSIKNYLSYLENSYLPLARTELGLHAIPNGRSCYMALYRSYTSLTRTPEEVFDIGYKTVELNTKEVIKLGKLTYDVDSFAETIKLASSQSAEQFYNPQQLHQFYNNTISKALAIIPLYFSNIPSIELDVKSVAKYMQGIGTTAHYLSGTDFINAEFKYDPSTYSLENFSSAELVALHEGYPGHHLQIALSQGTSLYHKIEILFTNSAYSEGWARYSEILAEEAGLFQSKATPILRRTWSGRAMVADSAMHILGWDNNSIARYLAQSGKAFARSPDVMMDRMAAMPAQLTSYETGAQEILLLRKTLKEAHGDTFNIKNFHHLVLKNGNVPISVLKNQVLKTIQ